VVPHAQGAALLRCVGCEQALNGLLRASIARGVDVLEGSALCAQRPSCYLGLASALVGNRHMVIGDALNSLARFIVEEERVALLRDVASGFGVTDEHEQ